MLADYLSGRRTAGCPGRFQDRCPLTAPVPDDELLAQLFIHTWTLLTGRMLRSDVPPPELTEQELIDFWADDRF